MHIEWLQFDSKISKSGMPLTEFASKLLAIEYFWIWLYYILLSYWIKPFKEFIKSWSCGLDSLESKGFKLNSSKTEKVQYQFGSHWRKGGDVSLDGVFVPKCNQFNYLGSIT